MSLYCLKDDETSSDILKRCFTKTDINFLESDNMAVSTMVNLVSMQNYGELHEKTLTYLWNLICMIRNLANLKSCIKELRFIIGIEYSFLLILYFYMHFVIGCSIYF